MKKGHGVVRGKRQGQEQEQEVEQALCAGTFTIVGC